MNEQEAADIIEATGAVMTARRVSFGTPATPGGRLSDMDGSLTVEQREDGSFRVTILIRGARGGQRRESVILNRRRARRIVAQWAPLVEEESSPAAEWGPPRVMSVDPGVIRIGDETFPEVT